MRSARCADFDLHWIAFFRLRTLFKGNVSGEADVDGRLLNPLQPPAEKRGG
jgi:hypothetical protein